MQLTKLEREWSRKQSELKQHYQSVLSKAEERAQVRNSMYVGRSVYVCGGEKASMVALLDKTMI